MMNITYRNMVHYPRTLGDMGIEKQANRRKNETFYTDIVNNLNHREVDYVFTQEQVGEIQSRVSRPVNVEVEDGIYKLSLA